MEPGAPIGQALQLFVELCMLELVFVFMEGVLNVNLAKLKPRG